MKKKKKKKANWNDISKSLIVWIWILYNLVYLTLLLRLLLFVISASNLNSITNCWYKTFAQCTKQRLLSMLTIWSLSIFLVPAAIAIPRSQVPLLIQAGSQATKSKTRVKIYWKLTKGRFKPDISHSLILCCPIIIIIIIVIECLWPRSAPTTDTLRK